MDMVLRLAGRNIKVYLRDRTSVFFSFLSVLIIIGLYVLFLGDMTAGNVENAIGGNREGVRWMVDAWIMSGVLVVNAMTVPLGALGVMVDDRSKKRLGSFLVAPVQRSKIVQGYLISAIVVGILLGTVTLILSQLYIVLNGGELLQLKSLAMAFGLQLLNVFSSGCIVFFLISWVKTPNAFGTLSTMIGTLVGFLAGVYIPVGVMPPAVQTVMKFNPLTHGAALMRQIYMDVPMDRIMEGAPPEARLNLEEMFGIRIFVDGSALSTGVMLAVIVGVGAIFLFASILRTRRMHLG